MLKTRQVRFPLRRALRNPHVQGLLSSGGLRRRLLRRTARRLEDDQQTLLLDCGDVRLLADWNPCKGQPRGLVVLLHGWEGSSQSNYMVSAASTFREAGFHTLRLNLRDHGPTHHLNRELFNSTRTGEVTEAIGMVRNRHRDLPCHLVGFSLGGSFALRIAADSADTLALASVIAVCPPVNPARVMRALNDRRRTYGAYFYRKWKQSLATKLEIFPELNYGEALKRARNLDDLNAFFVPEHTPYPDPASYFAAYAISGSRLAKLQVPAWLISARDDPVTPEADIDSIDTSVPINIEISEYGGHCGFLCNFRLDNWIDSRLLELVNGVTDGKLPD